MGRIAIFAIRNRDRIFLPTLLVMALVVACIPMNHLNDDVIKYFDENTPLRKATAFTEKHLIERQRIIFSLDSTIGKGINDPLYLTQLEKFTRWLRAQAEVTRVFSYEEIIKRLNKNMHGDDADWYKLPQTVELAAQYLLLYEMSLSDGQDLSEYLNGTQSASRVLVVTTELQNREILDLEKRANQWLAREFEGVEVISSSETLMFAKLSQDVKYSMISGSVIALVLISVVLIWGLQSFKYGLLSLVPNAFPAAAVYGLWGIFGSEVNMAVAVTFSISLGIIVDDTVHILSKYLRAKNRGESAEQAIESTFRSTGAALFVTTAVIVGGLLIQAQSDFGITSTIGLVCAPIIALALLFDLYFLPALLLKIPGEIKPAPWIGEGENVS